VAATREALAGSMNLSLSRRRFTAPFDARARGAGGEDEWNVLFARYRAEYPERAAEFDRRLACGFPETWQTIGLEVHPPNQQDAHEDLATRAASQRAGVLRPALPSLVGGSADLAESTGIPWAGCAQWISRHPDGNLIYYGAREFAMNAIMNGLALHGGYIPFGGTFLMFADYGRSAIRMSALMKIALYVHADPRFYRRRRRWPDASAGRTCGQLADHPRSLSLADLRYHGDRRGLEDGAGAG
jgi:transketolase